jgi:hypothetical protein
MTYTRERGLRYQYLAAAVVCPSSDGQKLFSLQEQGILSCVGSPP